MKRAAETIRQQRQSGDAGGFGGGSGFGLDSVYVFHLV